MINLSFIVPHSPILIPNIGKKNSAILKRTTESLLKIKNKIIKNDIDTIILISPHKKNITDIEINNYFQFDIKLEEFGDYLSKIKLEGDLNLSYKLKEIAEPDFFIKIKAEKIPDHGSNIPLYLLLSENNQVLKNFKGKIIIINTSTEKDLEYHFAFGQKISDYLKSIKNRVAIIASAELSHCLNYNAPGGFYQKANLFDDKTIENIKKGASGISDFLKTDPKLAQEAKECGLRPIALLLGAINSLDYKPETLSYQKDLGVGYLTMDMGI